MASEAARQIKTQAGVLLNCLVVSRRPSPSVFKKRPGVAETRPNGPSQSIKSYSGLFSCSLRCTGTTTILCGQYRRKNKDDIRRGAKEKEGEYKWREIYRLLLDARHAENHWHRKKQTSSARRSRGLL